jgi:hypothetical protein
MIILPRAYTINKGFGDWNMVPMGDMAYYPSIYSVTLLF